MLGRLAALIAVAVVVHLAPPPPPASAEPAAASADGAAQAPANASKRRSSRFPAVALVAGELAPVRSQLRGRARTLQLLRPLRPDGRLQVLLAVGEAWDRFGRQWYRVRLQHRPNGTTGWVLASRVRLHAVRTTIVVRRAARTLTVRRGRHELLRARVAIGAANAPTPLGSFFVTARFRPQLAYLGAYAFETSAFSRLSDWPGGGIVGIHGTDQPELLGRAVSHGCIRLSDRAVRRLRRLVPLGAPLSIRR